MMETLIVKGGPALSGTIQVSGSKNSSLPILAATLLMKSRCVIRRVPDVSDTNYMLQILNRLGAEVERASGTVAVSSGSIDSEAPYDIVRKMRASICLMGPLLARLGEARVSLPGGCVIGDRPVDLHLKGLAALGAKVTMEGGYVVLRTENGLRGAEINLRGKFGSTVLGTDNVMMAAALATGKTVIEGAATEPEVVDLADFLNEAGAKIRGAGTRRIEIEGVSELSGVEHTVIPDRIEAGTFMAAAAIAGGTVALTRVRHDLVESVTQVLRACGHDVDLSQGDCIRVTPGTHPCGARVTTSPYPGFPTDMQAQMTALFAVTPGLSAVTDAVFPERFMHLAELGRMGARIERQGNTALIEGVSRLSGAPVMASDLRASAALVLAALKASGTTEINRLYHIDRGYEHIDEKFISIGAEMERVKAS